MNPECGTTYCDRENGHVGTHCMVYATPEPTHRIEWTGNIQVHHPVIESIREREPFPVHIPEHLRRLVTERKTEPRQ